MAVAVGTVLAQTYDNVDRTAYTTASVTPTAGRIVYLVAFARRGTVPPTPTISGTGWASGTWTLVAAQGQGGQQEVSVWWILCPASPSAGTVTMTYAGASLTGCGWWVFDVTGQSTTAPAPQAPTATGTGTVGSNILATPLSGSGMFAAFVHITNESITIDGSAGWAQVGATQAGTTPNVSAGVEFNPAADTASIQMSWATSSGWAGVAWEAASPASGADTQFAGMVPI